MKKAISLLLAIVLCLSLCACGGNGITNQSTNPTEPTSPKVLLDGKEASITASDICKFPAKYEGHKICVTGEVKRVTGPYYYNINKPYYSYYDIELAGGWKIRVDDEDPIISIMDIGSMITAEGYIMDAWVTVLICGRSGGDWYPASTKADLAK